ncbi:MAG: biotin transporter BioY [Candidatus Omnitrophica bacterium]|nr:biotin transporter BioY [Candidatus Omnitrophota bacterium]
MNAIAYTHKRSALIDLAGIISCAGLMVLASYVKIPLFFTPVPLTLQTFVLFLSILYLRKKAVFSQLLYVVWGVSGLSVFSHGGAGLAYFAGPTGGYILGFLFTALIVPYLLPSRRSFGRIFGVFFLANICIVYGMGILWLWGVHHFSLPAAVAAGVLPFFLADTVKIALVSSFPRNS